MVTRAERGRAELEEAEVDYCPSGFFSQSTMPEFGCPYWKFAPHDLRGTCARSCHASGGELEQIQLMHAYVSVRTT